MEHCLGPQPAHHFRWSGCRVNPATPCIGDSISVLRTVFLPASQVLLDHPDLCTCSPRGGTVLFLTQSACSSRKRTVRVLLPPSLEVSDPQVLLLLSSNNLASQPLTEHALGLHSGFFLAIVGHISITK